jgi:hypothetical protein
LDIPGYWSRIESKVIAAAVELISIARLTLASPLIDRSFEAKDLATDLFRTFATMIRNLEPMKARLNENKN